MSYTVLARRYRSTTFEDVVGQEPIAQTLQNAITSDRTAHAYLFSGTRGVGKTSMARIFARELNMSDKLQEIDAIGTAILRGEDLDVIEIDGASNRGVQEARDLIAASGLAPARCRYRIYIIDEVHMLTTPAFNALLKTMEEPPSHVKFILCTTEPHKVPATIQSRCQRFDFRAISSAKIASHLTYILQQEGVTADPEVVSEVARLGNGSMRDALSILDRLLASGTSAILKDEMEELLGLPSQIAVHDLCNAISGSEMKAAFVAADSLIASGIALDRILEVVAITLRNALISRVCGESTMLLELSDESRAQVNSIGNEFDEATLTHLIALCDATSRQVRRGGTGRAIFDATIARLCLSAEIIEAGTILSNEQSTSSTLKKKRLSDTPTPISNKKLKLEPSPTPKQNVVPTVKVAKNPSTKQDALTEDSILRVLSSTPGVKKIATHLRLESLKDSAISLTIAESGRETANYILAQRSRIEEAICAFASKRFTVTIKANSTPTTKEHQVELEEMESHTLVQAARGLFDGTVVKVTAVNKEQDSCH